MTQEQYNEIKKVLNDEKTIRKFEYLYERWQDEKEYEDFNEYAKVMMTFMPKDAILVKGTKRPFGVVINYGGYNIHIALKRTTKYISLTSKIIE